MSDLRFDDVVETTRMIGRDGRYVTLTCKSCSEQRRVLKEEFMLNSVDVETMEYVAEMRAWNCCHEGEEPLDGFPEGPRERVRLRRE